MKKQSGLTLIEAIIVVAILGILILLVTLFLKPQLQLGKARDGRRKADLKKISTALEDYAGDHTCYPEAIYQPEICEPADEFRPYLNPISCDPLTHTQYGYVRPDGCSQYVIYANLELEETGKYGSANYALSSSNLRVIPTVFPTPTSSPAEPTGEEEPTATPTPTEGAFDYGCFAGVCRLRGGVDCSPKYPAGCYGPETCGTPEEPLNECR